MGVRGLQYYLENCCPSASPTVNIAQLVESKRIDGTEKLVIVVDGCSCIRHLYGDLEWIGGGQLKQFADKAQKFVQAFESLGIHLVFFFDGPTIEEKRNTWVERRLSKVDTVYSVLDKITQGTQSTSISKECFLLPPGMGQLSRVIFQNVCGCQVFQSTLRECDEEIAEYARNNKVFAVLTQDSDYVILDLGEAYYLSMQHLNLENMTTKWYNRWELASSLRIHHYHLPLLATLMGNDVVTAQELKPFHMHISKENNRMKPIYGPERFRVLVPKIAGYIQSLPLTEDYIDNRNLLVQIANRVFRNHRRDHDIRSSLRSYDNRSEPSDERETGTGSDPWSQLVIEARLRHENNEFPSMVFAIMSGLPFESSTSIEDYRRNDIPSFATATEPLRQRIYGILLQEKPLPRGQRCHLVREWCMAGPHSLDEAQEVQAVLPEREYLLSLPLMFICFVCF